MRKSKMLLVLGSAVAVLLAGCTATVPGGASGNGDGDGSGDPIDDNGELEGVDGAELLKDLPSIDVPFSNNTKMLNFVQLRNEVQRATTRSWVVDGVEQWDLHRTVLGGADFSETWQFHNTPSQQKILTIRRMAFSVCGDLVAAEAGQGERTVFTEVDPGAAIDPDAPSTDMQILALYERFFREPAPEPDLAVSRQVIVDLQAAENQRVAWTGLCAAYLASMRFLTY